MSDTIPRLRMVLDRLMAEPRDPKPSELLRILDGIVVALEELSENRK